MAPYRPFSYKYGRKIVIARTVGLEAATQDNNSHLCQVFGAWLGSRVRSLPVALGPVHGKRSRRAAVIVGVAFVDVPVDLDPLLELVECRRLL